jgi:predicted S18 family serine protease
MTQVVVPSKPKKERKAPLTGYLFFHRQLEQDNQEAAKKLSTAVLKKESQRRWAEMDEKDKKIWRKSAKEYNKSKKLKQ